MLRISLQMDNSSHQSLDRLEPLHLDDFRNPRAFTHGLFRFPGRFHPPLIAYLLTLHPGAKVIGDPMVGCGTAAVETVVSGRSGLFSDIDPLACLLTRAKSRPIDPDWLIDSVDSIVKKSEPFANPSASRQQARKSIADLEGSTRFRAPPDVFHWFQPYVVINLCRTLYQASEWTQSTRRVEAILGVFAAVIRKISRADPATSSGLEVTKVRKRALRNGLRFDVGYELRRKAKRLSEGFRELQRVPRLGRVRVVQLDVKKWSGLCNSLDIWPDLIVTSPCYMSAIEYWRRHKLEHCWLGLVNPNDLSHLRKRFLGMGNDDSDVNTLPTIVRDMYDRLSMMKRYRDAKSLANYFADSRSWLMEIERVLARSHGTAYIVAGGNTNHGFCLDTPLALQEIASHIGLIASTFMRYHVKNSYMQYPTNGNRIKAETVLKVVEA